MPLVRIDLSDHRDPATRRAISDGVHRALVDVVGIPEGDRFHVITTHPDQELIADPEYLGVHRRDVVYIQILLVAGRPAAMKQRLYRTVVDRLGADAGVRPDDVAVVLSENAPVDYSWGLGEAQLLGLGPIPGVSHVTSPAS